MVIRSKVSMMQEQTPISRFLLLRLYRSYSFIHCRFGSFIHPNAKLKTKQIWMNYSIEWNIPWIFGDRLQSQMSILFWTVTILGRHTTMSLHARAHACTLLTRPLRIHYPMSNYLYVRYEWRTHWRTFRIYFWFLVVIFSLLPFCYSKTCAYFWIKWFCAFWIGLYSFDQSHVVVIVYFECTGTSLPGDCRHFNRNVLRFCKCDQSMITDQRSPATFSPIQIKPNLYGTRRWSVYFFSIMK